MERHTNSGLHKTDMYVYLRHNPQVLGKYTMSAVVQVFILLETIAVLQVNSCTA